MSYTAAGKNLMLAALAGTNPTTPITHVGLFTKSAAVTTATGTASTDVFAQTAHGMSNGQIVVFTSITGGGGELRTGMVYFVINANANDFQLSETPAGAAVNFSSNVTASTYHRWNEISGGSPAYARGAIAYNTPALGIMDDSTNGRVFDVPAGAQINGVGYHSASTAGTLLALDEVTQETFGAQGTYTLTDSDLDLNASDAL